jgi:hypothetical protein
LGAVLILVVDDDFRTIHTIDSVSTVSDSLAFNFTVADYGVGQGFHQFAFYAIDSDGNVAPPVGFSANVVAPTPTASHTPSPVFSVRPNFPTHTPAPADVRIDVPLSCLSFDVVGYAVGDLIATSFYGYTVTLRVNGQSSDITFGESVTVEHVTLSFKSSIISTNAALLAFKLTNQGSQTRVIDVGIASDVYFDHEDGAIVSEIQPGLGLVVSSPNNALSFVFRDSILVTSVSTFWFGRSVDRFSNLWS